jgi:hypothetical protein
MELRVHLKVCEACGCLWYRTQSETKVYCSTCSERLRDFPTPQSRRRRGRPRKTSLPTVWAVATSTGYGSAVHSRESQQSPLAVPLASMAIGNEIVPYTGGAR